MIGSLYSLSLLFSNNALDENAEVAVASNGDAISDKDADAVVIGGPTNENAEVVVVQLSLYLATAATSDVVVPIIFVTFAEFIGGGTAEKNVKEHVLDGKTTGEDDAEVGNNAADVNAVKTIFGCGDEEATNSLRVISDGDDGFKTIDAIGGKGNGDKDGELNTLGGGKIADKHIASVVFICDNGGCTVTSTKDSVTSGFVTFGDVEVTVLGGDEDVKTIV